MKHLIGLAIVFLAANGSGFAGDSGSSADIGAVLSKSRSYAVPAPEAGPVPSATPANFPSFSRKVPRKLRRQILEDIAFIQAVEGSGATPLHKKIFGPAPVNGRIYLNFFTSRVKSITVGDCGGGPSAIACVLEEAPKQMMLGAGYIEFNCPQIARLDTLFHEARHTETRHDGWPHAFCPTPFKDEQGNDVRGLFSGKLMAGLDACDSTPFGSYGFSLIMLKNIQKFCVNCTEKVRMDAGFYGDDNFKRMIGKKTVKALKEDIYE